MTAFSYSDSPYPIRDDLAKAHRVYWEMLARPGNWWSGAERVAIAEEVRTADACDYCQERKRALSPYNFPGEHRHGGSLDPLAVDAVHRIVTDQNRITRKWIERNAEQGLSEEQYVELLGVVVTVFSIDEFHRALGLPLEPLPQPQTGEPDHYRPVLAAHGTGFVPMLPQDGATGKERDLWRKGRAGNVLRALSLVPDAVRGWYAVAEGQYLHPFAMLQFGQIPGRSINRMQMELIASRVSAVTECFY